MRDHKYLQFLTMCTAQRIVPHCISQLLRPSKLEYSRDSWTSTLNSSAINTTLPSLDQQDLNEKSFLNPPLWKESICAFKTSSASFLHSSEELICSPRQVRTFKVMCEKQMGKSDKFDSGQYVQKFEWKSEWCKDKIHPNYVVSQNSFHSALIYLVFYIHN